jgi:hypothetical protein
VGAIVAGETPMAVITNSTFDPLKTRVNVRLQQSVPIADADWNELDDIRKFELRALLRWFVGDGVPDGSAAFRIDALPGTGAPDDFIIRSGTSPPPPGTSNVDIGLRFSGRAVADGLQVLIPADVSYKAQPLFAAPGPGGIPQIQPIPVVAGPVLAYLDIWERLITSTDDPSMVLRGLGAETCVRTLRDWAVRTRLGAAVPATGDPDFIAGHSYLALSSIDRKLASPGVAAPIAGADLTDARRAKLSLSAIEKRIAFLEATLLPPVFGPVGLQLVPKTGSVGQPIDLMGRNFNILPVSVKFGSTPATVGTVTANDVRVTLPSLAAGTYSVSITTAGGGPVTATDVFTVI